MNENVINLCDTFEYRNLIESVFCSNFFYYFKEFEDFMSSSLNCLTLEN